MDENIVKLPNSQRSRQLVGVLSISSHSPASPLLEYCQDTITDEKFAQLLNLRDTCQKKIDEISRRLRDIDPLSGMGEVANDLSPANPSSESHAAAQLATGAPPALKKLSATGFGPEAAALPQQGILLQPEPNWVPPVPRGKYHFRVAAFDLDGSLLRGEKYVFSWELVWRTLGFGRAIQNELRREYHRQADKSPDGKGRIESYRVWCERAVKEFRKCDLTRSQLRTMAKALRLTVNCREALRVLRAEGIITVLISGGINVFLEDVFQDFRDYFDFVFINELLFTSHGMIDGVRATAYDFEGKAEALAWVCHRVGATVEETVFIGDHYNDKTVMTQAKKAIAYPSNDAVPDDVAHVTVAEDDLLAVVPHILVP